MTSLALLNRKAASSPLPWRTVRDSVLPCVVLAEAEALIPPNTTLKNRAVHAYTHDVTQDSATSTY